MGLDMYLEVKVFIGGRYRNTNQVIEIPKDENMFFGNLDLEIPVKMIDTITLLTGVWRKANHIHQYFADKCGNGEDDCREMYVNEKDLEELKDLCKRILKNHELAPSLLPTQEGFFFGSTEYDEYYFSDLEDTIKIINETLKCAEKYEGSIYYVASW